MFPKLLLCFYDKTYIIIRLDFFAEKEAKLANFFWKAETKIHNLLRCQTVNVAQYLACCIKKKFHYKILYF